MGWRTSSWLLSIVVAGCALAPGAAFAAFPGESGRIAFGQGASGELEIRTMDPDGSDSRTVTSGLAPSWSPDGRWLAFATCCDVAPNGHRRFGIAVTAPGGGPASFVAGSAGQQVPSPEFSPAGDELVYTNGRAIRTVNLVSGANRKLRSAREGCCLSGPTYSPDGSRIAFGGTPRNQGKSGIWTMRANGSRLRRLTEHFEDSSPDFSPDGRRIAFQRRRGDKGVAVMRADGSRERTLPDSFFFFGPVFAPAGDRIAAVKMTWFGTSKSPCGTGIAVMPRDGSSPHVVYPGDIAPYAEGCVTTASWQPLPGG